MSLHTPESFLAELRRRGAGAVRRVVFRNNRTRLLSISRDRVTLNAHTCFLDAPAEVLDAVARFVTADPRSAAHRRTVAALRAWPGVEDGLRAARARAPARAATPRAECSASPAQLAFLRELYARFNAARFGGRLPGDLPIRVSRRMARRLGQVRFEPAVPAPVARPVPSTSGRSTAQLALPGLDARPEAPAQPRRPERRVLEMALSADLFVSGNERELVDTVLHEMAHVEAFLVHGHKGHGAIWRTVARRVGCEDRACTKRRIRRRPRGGPMPEHVPEVRL